MNAPTLLVGLGGKGSDIVQRVYKRATPKQRANLGFVVFDTDVNELRKIEENTPQIHTVQTSTRLTVGEYLDVDHYSRDNWFPVNQILNSKALTEGAGQVRAVSRLALNTAIQQGKMAPLDEAIEELYKLNGEKLTQSPRVIITGSLCGGTGSGLILPVSMYIRNFLTTRMQQGAAIIRGFFLLPEIFNSVIKTQSERNNLRSNAYAAIREIDAFMTKDDNLDSDKYNLHFMVPRAGSKGQEEYLGRPMDFCFLFDAQNLGGMKLNSFEEYIQHAADSIYAMAIAPTSKRSNSSEDNVIREIIYAGGRNRYAGAGCSILDFPTKDIKKYLSLTWAKDSVSDEWLEIDKRFADEQRTNKEMRRQGYQVPELDRGKHYIQVVNDGFHENRPFESAIRNLCMEYDESGYVVKGETWNMYLDALDHHVETAIADKKEELRDLLRQINIQKSESESKEATEETYSEWYEKLQGFKQATISCTTVMARNMEYSLFKENKDYTKSDQRHRLEYWLHHNENKDQFIHPNAVRYFLYNLLGELERRRSMFAEDCVTISKYWDTFEKKTFDLEETENYQESPDEFYTASYLKKNTSKIKQFLHRSTIADAKSHLAGSFNNFFNQTNAYWAAYITKELYGQAIKYISRLNKAFHDFYDVLDRSIGQIDHEIEELEKKYVIRTGEAVRYVCADEECMKGMRQEVVNPNSCLDIPSDLNSQIFQKMKEYALMEQKPAAEKYFRNVFKSTILGYLDGEISSKFGSIVDMDIISALQHEACYKNVDITAGDINEQQIYARHVIEETRILAQPFIESPMGKEPRVIPACAYSPELAKADFPKRKQFVSQYLKDGGGEEADEIEPSMILFYQAVYDLRANELSKFSPPRQADTYGRPGGEYYKAYFELIQHLHPQTEKSKVITPHIDRWWHVVTKLPDLDEESQKMQEREIYAAFFWGMLGQFIQMKMSEQEKHMVYYADRVSLEIEENLNLIISNGTVCDRLYEVLDAFTIYPRLVKLVLSRINGMIDADVYDKVPLNDSVLVQMLEQFRMAEFELPENDSNPTGIRSIFDLPILMKRSVPAEEYYEEDVIQILYTILEELQKYLKRFCIEKDVPKTYGKLVADQFKLFILNMKIENGTQSLAYSDSLFDHICKMVAKELNSVGMREESNEVRTTLRELSSYGVKIKSSTTGDD